MKRLVIGDIHGCYAELRDLLDKAGLSDGDETIALGDIVDRGPGSVATFDLFTQTHAARSLMGNHERKHVRSFRGETRAALSQMLTRAEFGEARYPSAVAMLDGFARYLELPEAVLVHGFVLPGIPLAEQPENVLTGTMTGERSVRERFGERWYEAYDEELPLIVGHLDYAAGRPLVHPATGTPKIFGLDTGCCCGGALTGILLPEFRILSVPSRKNYWAENRASPAALAPLLHRVRRGELRLEQLRARFRKPSEIVALARRVGVLDER